MLRRAWLGAIFGAVFGAMAAAPAGAAPEGTLWAWGENRFGQVGDGTTEERTAPVRLEVPGCVAVDACNSHVLAIDAQGAVWAWGWNSEGQLGDGTEDSRKTPTKVDAWGKATAVAVGYRHSLVLRGDGTVWLAGDSGPLESKVPQQVEGPAGVVGIAAGQLLSLAVTADGTVWQWGGAGPVRHDAPAVVAGVKNVQQVACAMNTCYALTKSGSVYAWGANGSAEVGDGTVSKDGFEGAEQPTKVKGLPKVAEVRAGARFVLARAKGGSVWAWGQNSYGQLGGGERKKPTAFELLSGEPKAARIAVGSNSAYLLDRKGGLWGWGRKRSMPMKVEAFGDVKAPVQVPVQGKVLQVAGGSAFGVMLLAKGAKPKVEVVVAAPKEEPAAPREEPAAPKREGAPKVAEPAKPSAAGPAQGLAWSHEHERIPVVVALSENTVVTRLRDRLTATSLQDGKPRWEHVALHSDAAVELHGDFLIERRRNDWRVRDVFSGEEVGFPDASVRGVLERKGWLYVNLGVAVEGIGPGGRSGWTYRVKKPKKIKKGGDPKVADMVGTGELLVVAAGRLVIGLDPEKGKQKWIYDAGEKVLSRTKEAVVSQPYSVDQLLTDGKNVVARAHTRLWWVSDKGRCREELEIEKQKEDRDSSQPHEFQVFPGKRSATLLARRAGPSGKVRYVAYNMKGKPRHEVRWTTSETAELGPDQQVVIHGKGGVKAFSSAWRRLWDDEERQLVPAVGGVRETYVSVATADGKTVLAALDTKRGKPQATVELQGSWRALQVPGGVYVSSGKRVQRLDPATLEVKKEHVLPSGGAELRWSGTDMVFRTARHLGVLER